MATINNIKTAGSGDRVFRLNWVHAFYSPGSNMISYYVVSNMKSENSEISVRLMDLNFNDFGWYKISNSSITAFSKIHPTEKFKIKEPKVGIDEYLTRMGIKE